MLRVAVLVSGGGTNLQAVIDAIEEGRISNARIDVVISNNKKAYALERARKHGIQAVGLSPKDFENRDLFNEALYQELAGREIDLVVLAGCLVVIPDKIIREFENRIINIHPSQRLALCNSNWEDAFFITLARNFGFGLNGDAFETWAGLLPFRAMDKHRNDLFQIEAFFYGLAGLLKETFLKKEQEDEYSLRLCKEFRYLQRKFEIGQGMDATLWRFLRLRPENFPHIRLAQLAYLYQKGDKLFSRLLEAETLADVRTLLDARTSPYWENHYLFVRLSSQKEKAMGERSKDLIIINTVVPFLYTYGLHKADERMCERAGRFLEELKAESNHIIRSWSDAGLPVVSAADSQALIQLQKEYCDKRKCLYCRFGYEYLKHT